MGSRKRPYWLSDAQRRLVRWLRARGRGPTWLFDHDNRRICSLLLRAGWLPDDWCHHEDIQGLSGSHFCDRWLRFAYRNPRSLGGEDLPVSALDAYGELTVTAAQRALVSQWLQQRGWSPGQLVLVQVGNKRTMRPGLQRRRSNLKYWPEQNWAAVLRGLRELHPGHAILLLGVPQEGALNERILELAGISGAYNVVHELSISKLIGLSEVAAGMVSVDTGPAHVAAAVGCTVVTLFGTTEPFMYAPRGRRARVSCLIGERQGVRSMLYIEPSQVLTAWRQAVIEHAAH
jgi:heptosyltransferase-2/heptosyltransferase-3